MKEDNLICVKNRFKLQTTYSNHGEKVNPNLAKNLEVTGINQLRVVDITYIQVAERIRIHGSDNRCFQQVVHWLGFNNDTQLTLNDLLKALQT